MGLFPFKSLSVCLSPLRLAQGVGSGRRGLTLEVNTLIAHCLLVVSNPSSARPIYVSSRDARLFFFHIWKVIVVRGLEDLVVISSRLFCITPKQVKGTRWWWMRRSKCVNSARFVAQESRDITTFSPPPPVCLVHPLSFFIYFFLCLFPPSSFCIFFAHADFVLFLACFLCLYVYLFLLFSF